MLPHSEQVIKYLNKSRLIAALIVCVCIAAGGCNSRRESVIVTGQDEWREGDLVLRCGNGVESRAVTQSSHSMYSHIGLLHYDSLQNEWQVVHAVPGEDEPEYVKKEPVSAFFAPMRACRGAWLRIDCSDSVAREAVRYALGKAEEKVLFDNSYSLADTTQLYCTELVWRAYGAQGIDISGGRRNIAPVLFCKEGEGIFPQNIVQSETTLFVKPF